MLLIIIFIFIIMKLNYQVVLVVAIMYCTMVERPLKNSVSLILYTVATLRMAGALEKSSEVMKYMQQLVKVPEIQATMQELSKEMMKVCTVCCTAFTHQYLIIITSQSH